MIQQFLAILEDLDLSLLDFTCLCVITNYAIKLIKKIYSIFKRS